MISASYDSLARSLSTREGEGGDARLQLLVLKAADFSAREMHAAAEVEAFALIAGALLPLADEATACLVAEAVAGRADCPFPVIRALAQRGDAAAHMALRLAPGLDPDSLAIALMAGEAEALALATRGDLDSEAVAILLARAEPAVAEAIAGNPAAPLTAGQAAGLVERGRADRRLARALLARGERLGPRRIALFLEATPTERRGMIAEAARLARLDPPPPRPRDGEARPTDTPPADIGALAPWLADRLRVDLALADTIAGDASGEPLAVALRALAVPDEAAERCLVFAGAAIGLGAAATLDLARLHRSLDPRCARRILAMMIGADWGSPSVDPAADVEAPRRRAGARLAPQARDATDRAQPARAGTG